MATAAEMEQAAGRDEEPRDGARGPMDRTYFLLVWVLMVTGIVFVFSASFPEASRPNALGLPGDTYGDLLKHTKFVCVALAAMLITSLFPPRLLRRLAPWALGGGVTLMLITIYSPLGVTSGGARRWLDLGFMTFQPSELTKIAFIMMLAHFLALKDEGEWSRTRSFMWALGLSAGVALLLLEQRDQGMATIYAAVAFAMLMFAGMSLWRLIPLALGGLSTALVIAYQEPYRWRRIEIFLHPESSPSGDGYQILNMLIAQARGGITGMGLGMCPDKWRSLPMPSTDSIFSVIGAEMGLIGAIVVLVVVAALAVRGMQIATRARGAYGFYIAAGVASMLCVQSLAHIAVNTSCMPVTGLTLPFISAGGTSLVSASVGAGLILAASRYQRRVDT